MNAFVCVGLVVLVVVVFAAALEYARRHLDDEPTAVGGRRTVGEIRAELAHDQPPPELRTIHDALNLYHDHRRCGGCDHRKAAEAALEGGGARIPGARRRRRP
ncbi:hypothetical protein ACTD5D_31835 [Nocardia takedensis]|uniref:hypothetical protein n=1 Tax=Nocardia takedensis TaxID=259390 RepID=UPI003F762435